MPIEGIPQPDIIDIGGDLRLRKFDGKYDFAFDWYQDVETVYLVDGVRKPYSYETLKAMYQYLDAHGELYFIEAAENGAFRPIGDVTFWREDMPIVIGDKSFRGKKIGQRVVSALIGRARELGYPEIYVREIYEYNAASRKCFENLGFRACGKTDLGDRFILKLHD